ncbi:TetR/AcrR family transcriptional regulator, partial [Lactobacillus crispatus]
MSNILHLGMILMNMKSLHTQQ